MNDGADENDPRGLRALEEGRQQARQKEWRHVVHRECDFEALRRGSAFPTFEPRVVEKHVQARLLEHALGKRADLGHLTEVRPYRLNPSERHFCADARDRLFGRRRRSSMQQHQHPATSKLDSRAEPDAAGGSSEQRDAGLLRRCGWPIPCADLSLHERHRGFLR